MGYVEFGAKAARLSRWLVLAALGVALSGCGGEPPDMSAKPPLAFPGAFEGRWAFGEACSAEAEIWTVTARQVEMGGKACRIQVVQPGVDSVSLTLACEGQASTLVLAPMGESKLQITNGAERVLTRCAPKT